VGLYSNAVAILIAMRRASIRYSYSLQRTRIDKVEDECERQGHCDADQADRNKHGCLTGLALNGHGQLRHQSRERIWRLAMRR
jgi:hypothetical protein